MRIPATQKSIHYLCVYMQLALCFLIDRKGRQTEGGGDGLGGGEGAGCNRKRIFRSSAVLKFHPV